MNSFLTQFVQECISEVQHIPYYGGGKPEKLAWFSEEELEMMFENARDNVERLLKEENYDWILERSKFADDVERAIMLHMAAESIGSIVNESKRKEKIEKDPRFDGLFSKTMLETMSNIYDEYLEGFAKSLTGLVESAEKSQERPKISLPQ